MVDVYRCTRSFPVEERFGLQAQMRRSAVSVPTNLVEGSARRSTKDYLYFVGVSLASASELRYLLGLSHRLGFLSSDDHRKLEPRYGDLVRGLQELVSSLQDDT